MATEKSEGYYVLSNSVDSINGEANRSQSWQESSWRYKSTPVKSQPHSSLNPKYYDVRRAFLMEITPDKWVDRRIDSVTNTQASTTWTRYYTERLNRSDFEPVPGFRQNTINRATNAALASLRGGNNMQMAADMAESKKTLIMVSDAARRLANAYTAARHARWNHIPALLGMSKSQVLSGKFPANKWLEYQYGWKPLMGSVHDGIIIAKQGLRSPNALCRADGRASDQGTYKRPYPGWSYNETSSMKASCRLYYRVKSPTLDTLDRLGLINPLSVAWELTPFSFVLDWFVPVGNALSALTATAGLEFVSGYTNYKVTTDYGWTREKYDTNKDRTWISGATFQSRTEFFGRLPLGGFPGPKLTSNSHPFSTPRILNAVSLIRQLFR